MKNKKWALKKAIVLTLQNPIIGISIKSQVIKKYKEIISLLKNKIK